MDNLFFLDAFIVADLSNSTNASNEMAIQYRLKLFRIIVLHIGDFVYNIPVLLIFYPVLLIFYKASVCAQITT